LEGGLSQQTINSYTSMCIYLTSVMHCFIDFVWNCI